ncbi:hypothetical protein Btru_071059 [Bulinus truncatus]|nr:hypothetical protein Btru_071059 [Bulinus truncatus]
MTVRAIDLDSGVNGSVEYSIHRDTQSSYPNYFSVQSTGKLMALKSFDREQKDQYMIKILASDKGPIPLSSTATVELTIKDVNDTRPKFSPKDYYINVFDTDPAGSPVTRVFAFDTDAGDYAKVTYVMVDTSNSFKINSDSGVISTSRVLIKQPYRLTVKAKDGGDADADADAAVNVIVINTSSATFPIFNSSFYSFTITEDNGEVSPQIGRTIGVVGAFSQYGRPIVFAITGGDPLGVFTIDSVSGRISTQFALDREERAEYNLTVIACDGEKITSRIVNIVVTDLNDNAPMFITDTTEATVMENWPVGQNVFFAQAVDKDSGNNKELSYTLTSSEDTNQVFSINSSTGIIYLAKPTYHMPKTSVTLTVTATDAGAVHKSSSMTVIVTVVDVNDHTPLFPSSGVELFLPESQPVNNVVKVLSATDDDKGRNAELSYRIVRGNEDKKFGIFPDGSLYVAHELDREIKAMYSLMVLVKDNGESPRSSAVNITVFVEDVNDNRPQFPKDVFEFYIQENLPANTYVGTVKADDLDIGQNAEILYSLADANVNFTIDPVLGNVYSKISFDREYIMKKTNVSYSMFEIYATDNGQPKLQNKVSVKVHITDVNDNPPVFALSADSTIGVSENSNVNDTVFTFLAVDDDEGANAVVSYTIVKGNEAGKFGINAATGQLFLKASIDREQVDHYALTVKATDTAAAEQLEASITLNILVLDYNDNAPEFALDTLSSISVIETTSIGEVLVIFSGTDRDMGPSATLRYDIVSGNYDDALLLGMHSGKLTLVRSLDYESNNHGDHSLNITLSDMGFPSLSVARMFVVNVLDANDNAPIFKDGFTQFYFNETIPVGTRIAAVSAVDADSGDYGRVQYSLYKQNPSGYYFGINAVTGEITLSKPLDRETFQSFRLTIQAIDQDKAVVNRKTAEKSLTIIVQDANDNAPVFQTVGTFLVPYSSSPGNTIASVTATDQDTGDNGKVTYSFTFPKSTLFYLTPDSGTISLVSTLPASPLTYSLSIVAVDGGTGDALGPKSSTTTITLLIYTSINSGPTFSSSSPSTGSILENSPVGATVLRVEATSSQGLAVSYYISRIAASGTDQGELFVINRSSGVITTALVINREALRSDTLTVDIIAAEAAGSEQRVTTKQSNHTFLSLAVNPNPDRYRGRQNETCKKFISLSKYCGAFGQEIAVISSETCTDQLTRRGWGTEERDDCYFW